MFKMQIFVRQIRSLHHDKASRKIDPARECRPPAIEMTRGEDKIDWRPAISNCASQFQSIHGTWHVYVGKDDADVFSGLQDGDGFIGVGDFYRSVACCFHQIGRVHPTKKFILNEKNVWL